VIGQLIVRCFHAATAAHVLHLTTRSYATHKALNDFYDAIPGLVDSLAEAYIGIHGIPDGIHAPYIKPGDPTTLIADLADWIEDNRDKAVPSGDTCLLNIVDEIQALCASTLYKLRILK
jgi:DNA-binding ferritin-like protein